MNAIRTMIWITCVAFVVLVTTMLPLRCSAKVSHNSKTLRIATFNVSLNRRTEGKLTTDLRTGNTQAKKVAAILRTVRPDIVLLNEFDFDPDGTSIRLFQEQFLGDANGLAGLPMSYQYFFSTAVNTGVPSGSDFDHDGKTDGPGDAWGFGLFPGQYGMVVLSKFPIDLKNVRTFQKLLWRDMPAAAIPIDPSTNSPWYSQDEWNALRLSSKSHWDIPVDVNGKVLHVLASHPTPPAFDGLENRNGKRNHDEIRLWAEYLTSENCEWLVDDKGHAGGLQANASFVILGDQNADPFDGGSFDNAIQQLLNHDRVNATFVPGSKGAIEATETQNGANMRHQGIARNDTADFSDHKTGNLRVDYVLPSIDLTIINGGVFWPTKDQLLSDAIDCSDHRLVWLDLNLD